MTTENLAAAKIGIVEIEPRLAAVVRKTVPFSQIPSTQREARRALQTAFRAAGVKPTDPWLTVWQPPKNGQIDYAPGMFVAQAFDAADGITFITLPNGRAAHLQLRGPYDRLAAAWQDLFEACAAKGLETAGVNWEIYTRADGPPDDLETDLYASLV